MSEYIDKIELLKTIHKNPPEAHNERCAQLLEAVLNAPTADAVEVVRCKDCKWWKRMNGDKRLQCFHNHGLIRTTENDYCSRGERREENAIT